MAYNLVNETWTTPTKQRSFCSPSKRAYFPLRKYWSLYVLRTPKPAAAAARRNNIMVSSTNVALYQGSVLLRCYGVITSSSLDEVTTFNNCSKMPPSGFLLGVVSVTVTWTKRARLYFIAGLLLLQENGVNIFTRPVKNPQASETFTRKSSRPIFL